MLFQTLHLPSRALMAPRRKQMAAVKLYACRCLRIREMRLACKACSVCPEMSLRRDEPMHEHSKSFAAGQSAAILNHIDGCVCLRMRPACQQLWSTLQDGGRHSEQVAVCALPGHRPLCGLRHLRRLCLVVHLGACEPFSAQQHAHACIIAETQQWGSTCACHL